MNRLRKVWRFIHALDAHPMNADWKYAKPEGFMWVYFSLYCVGTYTGWLTPSAPVIGILAFIWATMLFFMALQRRTAEQHRTLLEAYGELSDDQTRVIASQRDRLLAYRIRDDFQGEGWKNGSPSLN